MKIFWFTRKLYFYPHFDKKRFRIGLSNIAATQSAIKTSTLQSYSTRLLTITSTKFFHPSPLSHKTSINPHMAMKLGVSTILQKRKECVSALK